MTTNWKSVLNKYLADFETQIGSALDEINELLVKSGQKFDDKIKELFVKSVNNRMDQAFDFFNIQIASRDTCEPVPEYDPLNSEVSNDGIEIVQNDIKLECISNEDEPNYKGNSDISSSGSDAEAEGEAEAEAIELNRDRPDFRPSLESRPSVDQRSTCSPSTSNLPLVSPIESPVLNQLDHIKRESNEVQCEEEIFLRQTIKLEEDMFFTECTVRMEEIPDSASQEISINTNTIEQSLNATNTNLVTNHEEPTSTEINKNDQNDQQIQNERAILKRNQSIDIENESNKKQRIDEVVRNDRCPLPDRKILYSCFYCSKQTNFVLETFETYQEVYDHWGQHHQFLPFHFTAVGVAACYYCGKIDEYLKLQRHHKFRHPSEIFVVVDQLNKSKCGLCHKIFSSSEMVIHFKSQHDTSVLSGITSPICFTQSEIEFLCLINSTQTIESATQTKSFMCGHCGVQKNALEISFRQHIECDVFQFKCSACTVWEKSMPELAEHEEKKHSLSLNKANHLQEFTNRLERHFLRSRIIFGNGLILFKHNLLNTSFDDRTDFWPFREQFARKKVLECFSQPENDSIGSSSSIFQNGQELLKQRKFCTNLCLTGINNFGADLKGLFVNVCTIIGVNVTNDDIQSIFQRPGNDIIIKLKDRKMKADIQKSWRQAKKSGPFKKRLQTFLNFNNEINITHDLTPFFKDLWKLATKAKQDKEIFRFYMTDQGLMIKISPLIKAQAIWSKADLVKCVSGKM